MVQCEGGNLTYVESEIKAIGAKIVLEASYGKFGRSCLHWATIHGHLSLVKKLLEAGVNVNDVDDRQWTALHFAVDRKHSSLVDLLLNTSADIEAKIEKGTPLHLVTYQDMVDIETLLDAGANINARDFRRRTPLITSVENGKVTMIDDYEAERKV